MARAPRDSVAMLMALGIGAFVMVSLILIYALATRGIETGDLWAALFALVASTMSALGGWLAGSSRRNGNGTSST